MGTTLSVCTVLAVSVPALILPLASADSLSGGAGWAGAGLLGLVLAWVLGKQIPDERRDRRDLLTAKDAQITSLIESRDKLAEKMSANAREAVQAVSSDNKESIREVIAAHREAAKEAGVANERRHTENVEARQQQFAAVMSELKQVHNDNRDGRHATKGVEQVMVNWLAVIKHLVPGLKDLEEGPPS